MRWKWLAAGAAVLAVGLLARPGASAAGEKYAVFGADTTPQERQELAGLFGVSADANVQTVSTPEMVSALQGTGLPVAPTDRSISSSVLTCGTAGQGLDVRTSNITRITAPIYANALVTAGVGDGSVLIAAPQDNPVTGETALVGVLKAFPQCQGVGAPDPNRVKLAYQQVAWTSTLAGNASDPAALNRASQAMLTTGQSVITNKTTDDNAIGAALDRSLADNGLRLDPSLRGNLIGFFKSLAGINYGTYARGYQVQNVSPTEVRVAPSGAAGAPGPAQAEGPIYTGTVQQTGNPLVVRSNGADYRIPLGAAAVTKDGHAASTDSLRRGDKVSITTNPDGTASRIIATSQHSGAGWLGWLILALLLLGLVALLALLLMRRRDSFVLEPGHEQRPHTGPRLPRILR